MHWFSKHGVTMQNFREAVAALLNGGAVTIPSVPASPASPTPAVTIRTAMKKGDYGPDVKLMQQKLIAAGFGVGATGADGSFGPATDTALRAFQKVKCPPEDGLCGPKTQSALGLI